jgi:hypothetical protein
LIFAIDPGPIESAYVVLDNNLKPTEFGKVKNEELRTRLAEQKSSDNDHFVIEMVASYGMAVGAEVFETVFWIGRFWECVPDSVPKLKIYRKEEKINLCGTMKAKDANIRQALIDRFGVVGTKKNPGWFYGVSKDVWAAIAVGVTYHDLYLPPQCKIMDKQYSL